MIHVPDHFKAFELVDRATYAYFNARSNVNDCFRYFDRGLLIAMDWIWENYPCPAGIQRAIHVNDWYWNGPHEWRGLRTARSPDYKTLSAHSSGRGIDFEANGCDDAVMQAWISVEHDKAARYPQYFGIGDAPILYLRRMEKDTAVSGPRGWTHVDTLEHNGRGLLMVNP